MRLKTNIDLIFVSVGESQSEGDSHFNQEGNGINFRKNQGPLNGKLFAQDIIWKSKKDKFSLTGRVALFSASYDNRFYTYDMITGFHLVPQCCLVREQESTYSADSSF